MNNIGFVTIDENTKRKNLADVLTKRCRGFLKPEVIRSVINRVDTRKQMKIDVLSREDILAQSVASTYMVINKGEIESVKSKWCRCLLGKIDFGKEVITNEDGIKKVISKEKANIVDYPLIVQVEEQDLGDIDSISTKILIYF